MRVNKSQSLATRHRDIGILLDHETILMEDGEWPYECTPSGFKLYAPRKLISDLFYRKKIGEILKYDGEITKWRSKCPSHYKNNTTWHYSNPKEVHVSHSQNFPEDPEKALEAYSDYRDWVESYGGNIAGSISSTSWSLFKSVLPTERWESPFDSVPGVSHPIGGRILPCNQLWTDFKGDFIQWDLYSAYSRRLAGLQFGGVGSRWIETTKIVNFDKLIEDGKCVYIDCVVEIPEEITLGPLPERRTNYRPRPMYNIQFPIGRTIEGIWTYEEIRNAERVGCRIKFNRAFIHIATGKKYFFEDWYKIIQEGRENLQGFSRGLAKQTGNALWGRFAMQIKPAKTIWRENGKRIWQKHPNRTLKRNQCMELADQLCGKIRSDLYELAISAGNLLIQGNTDGAWIANDKRWRPPNDDWRTKQRSHRIQLIDDTTYRYWREGEREATYIVPGINTDYTEKYFNERWDERETKEMIFG